MRLVLRIIQIPMLLIAACIVAGIYGIVHDQVTYTLSPDYYHHLKFEQFRVSENSHNRLGAAQVGWSATYWMGIVVGLPLLVIGFLLLKLDRYARAVCNAFGIAILTAATVGVLAILIVLPMSLESYLAGFRVPEGVINRESFLEVGMIHNASYLGGGIGFLIALGYLIRERWGKPVNKAKGTPRTDQTA